jgi:nucleoside phosphorylase/predicted nucleotidyltransferase
VVQNPLPAKRSTDTRTVQLRRTLEALTESFSIDDVYLFGSRRYRSTSLRSDIDLLVRPATWVGAGVATAIWQIEPYLDVFAADGGTAVSLANGSRIESASFDDLVKQLDAVCVWSNKEWRGEQRDELQPVLLGETPIYTTIHPTYVDGAPVLLMCALREEYIAVTERLGVTQAAPSYFAEGGATITIGSLQAAAGDKSVVAVSLLPAVGNVQAALATLDAIDSVHPRQAVLVGIAAGLRGQAELGDMVIPEVIVGYESTKATDQGDAFHGSMPETKPEVIARIKGWPGVGAWSKRWTRERASLLGNDEDGAPEVRLLFDAMASGEKVIADAARAQALTAFNRKVISVEMEALGFGAACTRRGIPFIVVKSVTDFADETKNDDFHSYCCRAAADLVGELIGDGVL